jgi:hypothetical protein
MATYKRIIPDFSGCFTQLCYRNAIGPNPAHAVWAGLNDGEIQAIPSDSGTLPEIFVRTQEGAEIVDGSSYVVACPRAEDATPVAPPAGLVFGLERAG